MVSMHCKIDSGHDISQLLSSFSPPCIWVSECYFLSNISKLWSAFQYDIYTYQSDIFLLIFPDYQALFTMIYVDFRLLLAINISKLYYSFLSLSVSILNCSFGDDISKWLSPFWPSDPYISKFFFGMASKIFTPFLTIHIYIYIYIYIYTSYPVSVFITGLKINQTHHRDNSLTYITCDCPTRLYPSSRLLFHLPSPAPLRYKSPLFESEKRIFDERTIFHKVWPKVIGGGEYKSIIGFSNFWSSFLGQRRVFLRKGPYSIKFDQR